MERIWIEYVGLAAGALTTAAYLPQVYRTWRSKAVGDISLFMYLSMGLGVLLWLVYGVLIKAPAVIAANGLCLALIACMLRMKVVYGRRAKAAAADTEPPKAQGPRPQTESLLLLAQKALKRGAVKVQDHQRKTWGQD